MYLRSEKVLGWRDVIWLLLRLLHRSIAAESYTEWTMYHHRRLHSSNCQKGETDCFKWFLYVCVVQNSHAPKPNMHSWTEQVFDIFCVELSLKKYAVVEICTHTAVMPVKFPKTPGWRFLIPLLSSSRAPVHERGSHQDVRVRFPSCETMKLQYEHDATCKKDFVMMLRVSQVRTHLHRISYMQIIPIKCKIITRLKQFGRMAWPQ